MVGLHLLNDLGYDEDAYERDDENAAGTTEYGPALRRDASDAPNARSARVGRKSDALRGRRLAERRPGGRRSEKGRRGAPGPVGRWRRRRSARRRGGSGSGWSSFVLASGRRRHGGVPFGSHGGSDGGPSLTSATLHTDRSEGRPALAVCAVVVGVELVGFRLAEEAEKRRKRHAGSERATASFLVPCDSFREEARSSRTAGVAATTVQTALIPATSKRTKRTRKGRVRGAAGLPFPAPEARAGRSGRLGVADGREGEGASVLKGRGEVWRGREAASEDGRTSGRAFVRGSALETFRESQGPPPPSGGAGYGSGGLGSLPAPPTPSLTPNVSLRVASGYPRAYNRESIVAASPTTMGSVSAAISPHKFPSDRPNAFDARQDVPTRAPVSDPAGPRGARAPADSSRELPLVLVTRRPVVREPFDVEWDASFEGTLEGVARPSDQPGFVFGGPDDDGYAGRYMSVVGLASGEFVHVSSDRIVLLNSDAVAQVLRQLKTAPAAHTDERSPPLANGSKRSRRENSTNSAPEPSLVKRMRAVPDGGGFRPLAASKVDEVLTSYFGYMKYCLRSVCDAQGCTSLDEGLIRRILPVIDARYRRIDDLRIHAADAARHRVALDAFANKNLFPERVHGSPSFFYA